MKKILSVILCCALVLSFTACSVIETNEVTSTQPTQINVATFNAEKKEKLENKFDDFDGIVYLTQNGEVLFSNAKGNDELGNALTADTPMYIGSVSKQFCATAIMMLKEQGKLSVDDTLDKYFPEYELGKDITIKNLLTMRSGIPNLHEDLQLFSSLTPDNTESENIEIINSWVFSKQLNFQPDTAYEYSNTNYTLLANIVEMVSEKPYNEFIRENIFNPLNMEHTGFVSEVDENDFFSAYLTYDTFEYNDEADGVAKGAGDIVSTAPDMDKWMTGLSSGEIITDESYSEMTTDYSSDSGMIYGYGLSGMYRKGIGHTGSIGSYVSLDYMNQEYGVNIFAITTKDHNEINNIPTTIMDVLLND